MSNVKKKYVQVGAMLSKKEADDQGRANYWVKIDDKTVVTVNGVKVKALNIQRPTDKFERMLASGKMTEDEYVKKMEDYEDDGKLNFIKFEIVAALDQ